MQIKQKTIKNKNLHKLLTRRHLTKKSKFRRKLRSKKIPRMATSFKKMSGGFLTFGQPSFKVDKKMNPQFTDAAFELTRKIQIFNNIKEQLDKSKARYKSPSIHVGSKSKYKLDSKNNRRKLKIAYKDLKLTLKRLKNTKILV